MTKVFRAKEDFKPLFRKGHRFIIVDRTDDPGMLPILAMKLKNKEKYGFYEGELE